MKLTCTLRLIEETFAAAAFAEEGEHETALKTMAGTGTKEKEKSTCCACSISRKKELGTLPSAA